MWDLLVYWLAKLAQDGGTKGSKPSCLFQKHHSGFDELFFMEINLFTFKGSQVGLSGWLMGPRARALRGEQRFSSVRGQVLAF